MFLPQNDHRLGEKALYVGRTAQKHKGNRKKGEESLAISLTPSTFASYEDAQAGAFIVEAQRATSPLHTSLN